jgi:hypothetical protein
LRPESAFHDLALELVNDNMYAKATSFNVEDLPREFISLYDLDSSTTPENNPYYSAIRSLGSLLHMECNHTTIAKYFSFVGQTGKYYKRLVIEKDPRALLLLGYWFGRVSHGTWWVSQRALMEGQGICLYLERYYPHETTIQELLQFPKMDLGLLM